MGGNVARMGYMRNAYKIFVGKSERKRPIGRHRRKCEDNIRLDLGAMGWNLWTGFIWLRIGRSGVS
jgi:hypothetical protein